MARKHEHFGLSYLEEMRILKERENICKESRQKFVKFKQAIAAVRGELKKPNLEVEPPETALSDRSSRSPSPHPESTDYSLELDSSKLQKAVRISTSITSVEDQTQDVTTSQKSSKKEGNVDKKQSPSFKKTTPEFKSDNVEGEHEQVAVVIASFVGTSKQLTMLKKPEPPPKPKYQRISYHAKSPSKSLALQKDSLGMEQLKQKITSGEAVSTAGGTSTSNVEADDAHSVVSGSSEKSDMVKEISKPCLLSSVFDVEISVSKRSSGSSSRKSVAEALVEISPGSTSSISKARHLSRSRSHLQRSLQKMPSGIAVRSIDEIIASLKSTTPTPSDLRIKELVESILGQDYNINEEVGGLRMREICLVFFLKFAYFSPKPTMCCSTETKALGKSFMHVKHILRVLVYMTFMFEYDVQLSKVILDTEMDVVPNLQYTELKLIGLVQLELCQKCIGS
ncbi:uncharacterized protein LOC117061472 [Lacerta agilis]|uniref:uncharacterized protein LOC117061472 n=1 Tax=Lacerta agilis TaxID=80427 RepID=UPI00141A6245|nr:uncharacterized protein LOC117061472 [Lacerta agilis]